MTGKSTLQLSKGSPIVTTKVQCSFRSIEPLFIMNDEPLKTCFKCNTVKPLSNYYKHPKMADGHLGKCKDCTKHDTAIRHEAKSSDPLWVISEMIRHREKSIKYRAAGYKKPSTPESDKIWNHKNRHKKNAHLKVFRAVRAEKITKLPCEICGNPKSEAHHEDYSQPLNVKWLCQYHHGKVHHKKRIAAVLSGKWDFNLPNSQRPMSRKSTKNPF